MKALLIYNDNIASQFVIDFEKLGSTYKYQVGKQELLNSNFTIDKKIDSILKAEIDKSKYDCIFIPYSLSEENYLEFTGLRFACHIRLTPEFNNLQTPIVFFGYETENEINKLSEIGTILFSKGIYTTEKISVQDFEKQVRFVVNNQSGIPEEIFLKQFTERVNISPSGNYATHHSITNEWSIYRWATALKVENEYIQTIEKNISSNLYFKYLKAQFPTKETIDANNQIITEDGKILYIDDEVEKGWDIIFRKICTLKRYESIGNDFKNLDSSRIVESAITKVNEFNPDVIILDFRLHDDDFENISPENVTGYKILKSIKEINKGIQVIILSATNKIWNLLELQKAGADGFILKESPQLSVEEGYSKNAITKIYKTINESLSKKYLKEIFSNIDDYKSKLSEIHFKDELIGQFAIFWEMLVKAETKEDFAYTYISLYMIIEIVNKHYLAEIEEECFWNEQKNEYEFKAIERLTEWNKIAYLYFKKWNETDDRFVRNLNYLIRKRNGFIHNDKNILDKEDVNGKYLNQDIYTKEGIVKLFKAISKIINCIVTNADTPHR